MTDEDPELKPLPEDSIEPGDRSQPQYDTTDPQHDPPAQEAPAAAVPPDAPEHTA